MRIAVFGGTFDPIHLGHLHVARQVRKLFGLDEIHFVVSFVPPHKASRDVTSPYHRYAMCVLATDSEPTFKASTVELEDPGRPYTIDTMEKFRSMFPEAEGLYFIAGADSFADIKAWKDYEKLLTTYDFIFVSRPGIDISGYEKAHPRRIVDRIVDLTSRRSDGRQMAAVAVAPGRGIYLVDVGAYDISSTAIREMIKSGESVKDLLPASVWSYISKYEVYRR